MAKVKKVDTERGWKRLDTVGLVVTLVVSAVVLFGNISKLGVWEPWEANEIFVAQEYAERGPAPEIKKPTDTSYNWAVPTRDQKPIARSLLKTWLLSQSLGANQEVEVGTLERSARMPFAISLFLLIAGLFFWFRKVYGPRAATVSCVAFATMPAIYLGAHNVATEMLFVVTTTAAIALFAQLVFSNNKKLLWSILCGIALALVFLDQRLVGIYVVLGSLAAWCITEVAFEQYIRRREGRPGIVGKFEKLGAVAFLGLAVFVMAFGWWWNQPTDPETLFEPHILQWYAALVPLLIFASAFTLGRATRVGRAMVSPWGWIALGIGAVTAAIVGWSYGAANPTLLDGGEVFGKIPVLQYFLENEIFGRSLAEEHMTFDIWVRQIGFTLIPWVALVPLGIGYLATATRADDEVDIVSEQESLKRLFLVWAFFAGLVLMVAAVYDHYFFPAYAPLAAAIGLMMTDEEFWKRARLQPLLPYAMGFVACATIMMVGKDLERFPTRFVEVYTIMEKGWELPEDFTFGSTWKAVKYGTFAVLLLHFFGFFSFAILTLRNLKSYPSKLKDAFSRVRAGGSLVEDVPEQPFASRAIQKEELRAEDGLVGRIARLLETPRYAWILMAWCTLVAVLFVYDFAPELTNHTSQRGVFETYKQLSDDDEALYRYDVAMKDESVYLQDLPRIQNSREFMQEFDSDERFFAVIPRKNLARINFEARRQGDRNIPVLDARSSRLLLISNRLEEGEEDKSFVAKHIFEEPPEIEYPTLYENKEGQKVHPVFDDALEMLGYNLDHEKESDGYAAYRWGETAVIDYYFRVKKRVPSSQKIFLHVDYPGNRINGDHYPNDGEFPTNYWVPGDIVRARHNLEIDNYATPGLYTLNFGFFLGSNRMKVEPREAHDGRNRITMGKFRVEPL